MTTELSIVYNFLKNVAECPYCDSCSKTSRDILELIERLDKNGTSFLDGRREQNKRHATVTVLCGLILAACVFVYMLTVKQ